MVLDYYRDEKREKIANRQQMAQRFRIERKCVGHPGLPSARETAGLRAFMLQR